MWHLHPPLPPHTHTPNTGLSSLQVVRNEGVKSLFKGAGANILRAVAGAGVLSGYDQLQVRHDTAQHSTAQHPLSDATGVLSCAGCAASPCVQQGVPGR